MIFIAIYGNFATISSFSHDFACYRVFPSDMGPLGGRVTKNTSGGRGLNLRTSFDQVSSKIH